jgi:hypothetical protein
LVQRVRLARSDLKVRLVLLALPDRSDLLARKARLV